MTAVKVNQPVAIAILSSKKGHLLLRKSQELLVRFQKFLNSSTEKLFVYDLTI